MNSIEVSPDNVEADLNNRLAEYIRRAGSEQALETYFSKSMAEIKKDLREMLTNQYIVQETQGTIAQNITVTPDEIKKYYNTYAERLPCRWFRGRLSSASSPSSLLTWMTARPRCASVCLICEAGSSAARASVRWQCSIPKTRAQLPKAESSGLSTRGEVAKPYAEAAWSLKKGAVSKIVETEFGFHIIQLIDRKGEMVNTRHILMRPKLSAEQTDGPY